MPFPRCYKTKEDKKAANRLKSKRYYDRNRKAILQSQQQKRVAAEEANTVVLVSSTSSVMVHVADSSENCSHSHLEKWKDHAVQAVAYLDKVVGISNMKYLNGLCKKFASELTANRHPHKVLDKAITKLGKIELMLKRCNAVVLQEAGIGPEYTVIHTELTR
ncbi:hypothetical protein L208DRAFT_1382194 [Tricholoma matsutake]|nr:hypothetical protein L208DRAFT_1382194 [Tricholoma matsutake 945]